MDNTNPENTNTMSRGNKTAVWLAVGCLSILACIVIAVVTGFGGLYWLGSQSPENAGVRLDFPIEINAGEDFQFEIAVTNTSAAAMELSSIDISLNYLNGFLVKGTTPPYSETSQFDALGGGETFQTYYYYQPIAPGETLTVIFDARTLLAGDYQGGVDVCIDSDFNCVSNIVRTIVK